MTNFHLFLKKNSSTILSCIGVVGVVGTAITTGKAVIKAEKILEKRKEEKGEDLTAAETIKAVGPTYVAPVLIGASTIVCILGANIINRRTQASLMSAYALVNTSYKEYKDKLKELYGQEVHNNIVESLTVEKAKDVQINAECLMNNCNLELECEDKSEAHLFYDEWSGRYFETTIEKLMSAEYHINRNFVLRGHAFLGEFYEFLGLEETDFGNVAGWTVCDDEIYWIDFTHQKVMIDDGLECYIVESVYPPTVDFLDW